MWAQMRVPFGLLRYHHLTRTKDIDVCDSLHCLSSPGNFFMRQLKNLIHYPENQLKLSRLCNWPKLNFYRSLVGLAWVKREHAGWVWGRQGVRRWWDQPPCGLALVCVPVLWLQLSSAWGLAFDLQKPLMKKIIVHVFSSFLTMFKNLLFYFFRSLGFY